MNTQQITDVVDLTDSIQPLIEDKDFAGVVDAVTPATAEQTASLLERLSMKHRAVVYRLLPKDRAIEVFERLSPGLQGDLIRAL